MKSYTEITKRKEDDHGQIKCIFCRPTNSFDCILHIVKYSRSHAIPLYRALCSVFCFSFLARSQLSNAVIMSWFVQKMCARAWQTSQVTNEIDVMTTMAWDWWWRFCCRHFIPRLSCLFIESLLIDNIMLNTCTTCTGKKAQMQNEESE